MSLIKPQAPNNLDAESSFLGSILLSDDILNKTQATEDIFYSDIHKQIFRAIKNVHKKNQKADIILLQEELNDDELFSIAVETMTCVPSAINWKGYEDILIKKHSSRVAIDTLKKAIQDAYNGKPIQEIVKTLSTIKGVDKVRTINSDDMIELYTKHIDDCLDGNNVLTIKTGIQKYDDNIGGIFVKGLTTIGAGSKVGKSLFASQVINNVAKEYPTLYISLEMPAIQIINRWVAQVTEFKNRDLQNGKIIQDTDSASKILLAATEFLSERKLFFAEDRRFEEIRNSILHHSLNDGVKCVIVDYAQLVSVSGMPPSEQRIKLEFLANELKSLAMETDTAIVLLSQLNDEGEFFGSQAMKFASDATIKIFRPVDKDGEFITGAIDRQIKCEYNRHAEPYDFTMDLDGDHQIFK